MYILVTGTAGLLGSKFTEWLPGNLKDVIIVGIDDLSGGYLENVPDKTEFFNISLNNYKKVEEIFQSYKFDYIFHFAAYAAEGLSPFIRKFNYNNNLLITTNLINMSIKYKIKRFIFTSSMSVYGEGKTPFDEINIPNPIDPYGIAKYACEMDLKVAKEQHGLDYCIIRPHNVYGENQNIWDKYRNVLGIWTYKYLNNLPLTIYGDGKQKRAFTYIEDILEPLWKAAIKKETSGEIINLGGIREIEIKEAAEIFRKIINNKEYPIEFLQERHEVKNAWSTHQKSVDLLGFEHKTSLKEGLNKMIEWAKKQPQREIKKWENYEINVDIYEYWK
tara:strand:- start:550 stop:1545 length:996 start_codon:yes stop_codon:yes gene_type:complete